MMILIMANMVLVVYCVSCSSSSIIQENNRMKTRSETAVGDPGMRRDGLRVAFEAWNFCNEVAQEAPSMGSPRAADCFDLSSSSSSFTTNSITLNKSKCLPLSLTSSIPPPPLSDFNAICYFSLDPACHFYIFKFLMMIYYCTYVFGLRQAIL